MVESAPTSATVHTPASHDAGVEIVVDVFAYNPERGDFDGVPAVRRDRDVYELVGGGGDGFEAGDLVRVELAEGELIVQERVYGQRLL